MHLFDDTGLCLACCRHCILLASINMKRGEIYAYPLFVQAILRRSMNINFFCQDVICKFWPYLTDVVIKSGAEDSPLKPLEDMRPFLSVMHGKTHDLPCQVGIKYLGYIKKHSFINKNNMLYLHPTSATGVHVIVLTASVCVCVGVCVLPLYRPNEQTYGPEFRHVGQVEEYLGQVRKSRS